MNFAALKTGLPLLIASLTEIPCDFVDRPRGMHPSARTEIEVIAMPVIGTDERVIVDVNAGGVPVADSDDAEAVAETVVGHREMTVQVTAWSLENALDKSARFYLERLRTRLRWTSSIVALKALGLGTIAIGAVVLLPPTGEDGRAASKGALDLRFSFVITETDAPTPFIETARVTATTPSSVIDINAPEP